MVRYINSLTSLACPECGRPHTQLDIRCPDCGLVFYPCPHCGLPTSLTDRSCPNCTHSLSGNEHRPRANRRPNDP